MEESIIEDVLITLKIAFLAKNKGFNEKCNALYDEDGNIKEIERYKDVYWSKNSDIQMNSKISTFLFYRSKLVNMVSAPTQSLLQKWLREIHEVEIQIFKMGVHMDKTTNPHSKFKKTKGFKNYSYGLNVDYGKNDMGFDTYEGALEKALEVALKVI